MQQLSTTHRKQTPTLILLYYRIMILFFRSSRPTYELRYRKIERTVLFVLLCMMTGRLSMIIGRIVIGAGWPFGDAFGRQIAKKSTDWWGMVSSPCRGRFRQGNNVIFGIDEMQAMHSHSSSHCAD